MSTYWPLRVKKFTIFNKELQFLKQASENIQKGRRHENEECVTGTNTDYTFIIARWYSITSYIFAIILTNAICF